MRTCPECGRQFGDRPEDLSEHMHEYHRDADAETFVEIVNDAEGQLGSAKTNDNENR